MKGEKKMVALMLYKNGLKFSEIVFENKEVAEKWLEKEGYKNPRAYEIIPVDFITQERLNFELGLDK